MTTRADKIEEALKKAAPYVYGISGVHSRRNRECPCRDCDIAEQVAMALALPADPASEVEKAKDEVVEAAIQFEIEHNVRELSMKDLALARRRRKELYEAVTRYRAALAGKENK